MTPRRAPLPDGRGRGTDVRTAARHAPEDRAIRARTLFGAVHGVVSISLEGRFVGLRLERLAREVDALVLTMAAGTERRR